MSVWGIYIESRDTDHGDELIELYATEELAEQSLINDGSPSRWYVQELWVVEELYEA